MDLRSPEGRRELGRRIHSAVAAAGHASLPAFAEELGCSRALIYQYVSGDVLVQLDRLQAIAELTGKALEWFLSADPNGANADAARFAEQLSAANSQVEQMQRALARERGQRLEQAARDQRALVEATRALCLALRRAGDGQAMLEAALRYAELARAADDQHALMDAHLQTGHACFITGNVRRAREALRDALQLADEQDDATAEHSARQELVRVLQALGLTDEAREQAGQVAAADRWWPRWSGEVSLAALAEQVGQLDDARDCLETAEERIEQGDPSAEHRLLARTYLASNRVNLALARGRHEEALELGEQLYALAAQAGLPDQLREATLDLGLAHLRMGSLDRAGEHFARLQEWALMSGDTRIGVLARVFEAERLTRSGDLSAAKQLALAALDEAVETGRGHVVAEAELALAEVYLREEQLDDARYHFQRAHDRAGRLALCRLQVTARLGLARTGALDSGPMEEARAELTRVAALAAEIGYEDLHAEAEAARRDLTLGNDTDAREQGS